MQTRTKTGRPAPSRDPELERQLAESRHTGAPVSAVFRLKPKGAPQQKAPPPPPTPKATAAAAKKALERASKTVGEEPERLQVFGNLGAFVVSGSPSLITELMAQPEVDAAIANRRPDQDLLVRPVARARAVPSRRKSAKVAARRR